MSLLQTALSTDKGINITNMALMVISAALSFLFPFELFLFVYAVLGPLHYLTEMSWLERRNFFIEKKSDVWLYLLMALVLTVPAFNPSAYVGRFGITFLTTAVCFTFIIFFVKQPVLKYILTTVVFFMSFGLKADQNQNMFLWVGVMLPTIIHVFVFTGLFILYGALKNKSVTGVASLFVFIVCAASFFFLMPTADSLPVGKTIQDTLKSFTIINKALIFLFGLDPNVGSIPDAFNVAHEKLFASPAAITVARFIAFAYTYHYLNWFSKTSVIKWHEVPKGRMILILVLWLASVAVYFLNYKYGFTLLFLFSMMHVLLEFPLNFVTIRGIGKETAALFRRKV
jgi:hypothetical protein